MLVVPGEVRQGFSVEEVKCSFQRLSRLNPDRVERLFQKRKALCKRNLNEEQAKLQYEIFQRKGIVCYLKKTGGAESDQHFLRKESPLPETALNPSITHAGVKARPARVDKPIARFPILFFGTANAYFRIWIVNLPLTLLTCGIYLPWARVRSRQYLYSKIHLDGHSFCYHARPEAELKIHLPLTVMLLGAGLLSWVSPLSGVILSVFLIFLFPWYRRWRLCFEAQNSAYRKVHFRFEGSLADAYKAYLLWPLLTLLSVGLLYPQMRLRQKIYLLRGLRYGEKPFRLALDARRLLHLNWAVSGCIMGAILVGWAITEVSPILIYPWFGVCFIFLGGFISVRQGNAIYNALGIGQYRLRRDFSLVSWLELYLSNVAAVLPSLGLLIPWAIIRSIRYRLTHTTLLMTTSIATSSRRGHC